jgi:hypothetical protein
MCWHESGVPPQSVLLPKLALASEILLQEIAVLKKQNTENEDNPDDSVKQLYGRRERRCEDLTNEIKALAEQKKNTGSDLS